MDLSWAYGLLDWLAAHPGLPAAFIFCVALLEGVVVAGIIVPGATLLFISGALVGTGHVPLWPSLAAAFLGAFCGDSISYLLGRRYGQRLRSYWPLSRYPQALAKGDEFFAAHGGKSLVFGRFFGPVRGIIPAIAGMMGMAPRPFFVVNLFSAFFWAPAYLFPGMVFGASLAVAASVATRLVALVLLVLGLGWGGWWLLSNLLVPQLRSWGALLAWRARYWGRVHPLVARALGGPRYALRALSYSAGRLWWVALAGLVGLAVYMGLLGGPTWLDEALLGVLNSYMAAGARAHFILPALLVEPLVWVPGLVAGVIWVARARHWLMAMVLLATVLSAALLAIALGMATGNWMTAPVYRGAPVLGFPAPGVAGFTALVLAVGVLATAGYGSWRWLVRAVGIGVALLTALCGVIAGRIWLLDAVAGVLLGSVMAGVVAVVRSSAQRRAPERTLPAVVASVLMVAVTYQGMSALEQEQGDFMAREQIPAVSVDEWWGKGQLDQLGGELHWLDRGRRRIDVQWLADRDTLVDCLDDSGWGEPERGLHGLLRWLQPHPDAHNLLPLARLYRGHLPQLIRVQPMGADERLVLRLWPAPVEMVGSDKRLWLATLDHERLRSAWPLARVEAQPLGWARREKALDGLVCRQRLRLSASTDTLKLAPVKVGGSQNPKPPDDAGHSRGGGRRESFPGGFLVPSLAPQTSTKGGSRHQAAVFRGSQVVD